MAKRFQPRKTTEERSNAMIEKVTANLHEEKEEMPSEKVGFSIKLPRHIYDKLTSEKKRTGMSRAAIILNALDLYWGEG